jgi:uncharacterized protein involved in high-affinity Fe2+ transport
MAFKMIPGRGNFAKTGRSIPSPFKQQTSAQVDKMIKDKIARDNARKESEKKASSDEASTTLRRSLRKAASEENESRAKSDSTSIDNRLRGAGFDKLTAGIKGNEAANETRKKRDNSKIMPTADHKSHVYDQVNKDEKSGKYKRTTKVDAPLKQKVSAEVDAMIKRKKDREVNEMGAKSDSTSTANKLQKAGFSLDVSGKMGNQAANEKRKQNVSPGGYSNQVDKDPKSGKYKMDFKKQSPAKQTKTTAKKMEQTAKGPSRDSMQASKNPKSGENKMPPGTKMDGDLSKSGKKYGSPAKQLGRQAVTKMGGKKTPAKMKSC